MHYKSAVRYLQDRSEKCHSGYRRHQLAKVPASEIPETNLLPGSLDRTGNGRMGIGWVEKVLSED